MTCIVTKCSFVCSFVQLDLALTDAGLNCSVLFMVTTPSMMGVLRRGCYSVLTTQSCCMPPTASITASSLNGQIASQHVGHSQLPCLQNLCHHLHSSQAPAASQVVANGQNPPKAPWTPTAQLTKRKLLTKRMGFLLQVSQCIFS